MDAEYTFLNPALCLLVDALALRWNGPGEGGPWVWNTYQAYLKVCGAPWGTAGRRPGALTPSCRGASPGHARAAEAGRGGR